MFKNYKYSVISKTHIAWFFRFLPLSPSNIRMSEGTFCRVEVHMYLTANQETDMKEWLLVCSLTTGNLYMYNFRTENSNIAM